MITRQTLIHIEFAEDVYGKGVQLILDKLRDEVNFRANFITGDTVIGFIPGIRPSRVDDKLTAIQDILIDYQIDYHEVGREEFYL